MRDTTTKVMATEMEVTMAAEDGVSALTTTVTMAFTSRSAVARPAVPNLREMSGRTITSGRMVVIADMIMDVRPEKRVELALVLEDAEGETGMSHGTSMSRARRSSAGTETNQEEQRGVDGKMAGAMKTVHQSRSSASTARLLSLPVRDSSGSHFGSFRGM